MNLARALTANMALLTVGKVLSIVLSLATMALLTRVLGPAEFGFYRSVIAYLGFGVIVSNLGLQLIFVREFSRDGIDQSALLGEGLSLRLVSAAVVLLGGAGLAWLFPYEPVVRWGILLSTPGFVALAGHQFITGVFQQKLQQTGPVVAEVAGGMVTLALILALLQLDAGVLPVLAAFVAGSLVTLAISWWAAHRLVPFRPNCNLATWRALIVPALPLAGASLLQVAYYKTDTIALSLLQPANEVGLYSVARQILDTFVGFAVMYTGLIMPLMSRHARQDAARFATHLRNGFDTLAVGAVGAAMLSLAFAPEVTALIGGARFADAAPALRALALLVALYPLCMITRYAVTALDRQAALLTGYALASGLAIAAFFLLIPQLGAVGAALGLLLGEGTVFAVALRVLRREAGVTPSSVILIKAVLCAATVLAALSLPGLDELPWLVTAAIAGMAYLVLLVVVGAIPTHLLSAILAPSEPTLPELRARANRAADVVARRDLRGAVREVKLIDLMGVISQDHVVSRLMQYDRWALVLDRYVGWSLQQVMVYVAGCVLFSLGVKLFIDADFGVDPLYSMVIGIAAAVDVPTLGIGFFSAAVTLLLLGIWSAWNRRWPPVSTFVTMALVGYLVDLWNYVGLEQWTTAMLSPLPMLLLGLLLDGYACALIIMSGIGIRVMDLLAISFYRKLGWPFLGAKLFQEAGFVLAALALGGPVGLGTVGFVAVVAPLIPLAMWANGRILNIPNYGLGSAHASA